MHQIIHIHSDAKAKPELGAPCNGCGICCLSEPCPLGMILSGRRVGACEALQWEPSLLIYRCGAITHTKQVLRESLPKGMQFMASALAPWLKRWAKRWIAAGQGCDCSLELERPGHSARQ
jgi:hypothetical protein